MIVPRWDSVAALYCLVNSMMLMPWGPSAVPTGGAGVALPACSSSLSTVRTFFLLIRLAHLLDLKQVELDGRLAPEHVDEHFELALLWVDLVDLAVEVGERTVDHPHGLADRELDADLRRLLLHLLLDRPDLFLLQRDGAVRRADEARDAGRVPDDEPRLVRHLHLHQDVAGEDALLDVAALAVFDLDLVFHGDEDLEDLVLHVHGFDPLLEVLLDLLLVPRVGVDDVPLDLVVGGRLRLLDRHQPTTLLE